MEGELGKAMNGLSVVTRFVQWFTDRGASYEHNLNIIDGHLKHLIKSNVSPLIQKQPNDNPMKYAHL